MKLLIQHWKFWLPFFLLIFQMISTVFLQSCWGISSSSYYYLKLQRPTSFWSTRDISSQNHTYPLCFFRKSFTHNGITSDIVPSVPYCYIYLVSLPKSVFLCWILFSVLVVYDVPPTMTHSILSHGDTIRLIHIHLYQVSLRLWQPCSYMLDEKELILWFFNITLKLYYCSLVTLSETPSVTTWRW